MKFAVYHPWIYLHGGIERSLLELVRRSRHDWTIFTGCYDADHTFREFQSLNVRQLRPTSVKRTYGGVLRSVLQAMLQKLPLDEDTDAIVVWCDGIGDMVTFRNRSVPVFNICSTPLRAAFDPVYEQLALAQRGPLSRVPYRLFKQAFRAVDRLAWKNYAGVIATSAEVRQRIVDGRLYANGAQMAMAYPGVDWKDDVSDVDYQPFVLLPGRIMWTKNIELGIRAFLQADLPAPWRLVVAGFLDAKSAGYLAQLKDAIGGDPRVDFVLSPTDGELAELYRTASFCLFTPLNEDWGIVPLEAMARAKPVIAVARGGPAESIVNGLTGYLLEPGDEAGWASAIRMLAFDPDGVRQIGAAAHRHVRRYSWSHFAGAVDDALANWMGLLTNLKGEAVSP
ncbi:MAG: glycosyltransferase [Betaproteobacteria bacterium]|nr:glycosyltransferase [Betaproteobacteria bacterium]